jgi:serine/threonine-protein kinase RsbW
VSERLVTSGTAAPTGAAFEGSAAAGVDPGTDPTAALSPSTGGTIEDAVEIRLPADSAFLSVLRTATAGLAARLDFTLDEIEDLRIAVDEACAMLLPGAVEAAQLRCRFELLPDTLSVTVTLPTTRGQLPERDTFSWTVLSALAGEVDTGSNEDREVWIRLRKRRAQAGSE